MTVETELSERELEILALVATGASNKEIAQKLVISPNTVKVHLRNIFAKIGASSRTEATIYAVRMGLVTPQGAPVEAPAEVVIVEESAIAPAPWFRRPVWLAAAGLTMLVLVVLGVLWGTGQFPTGGAGIVQGPEAGVSRWQRQAAMAEPRSGMAFTRDERSAYLIGGETGEGISPDLLRYDPWTGLWVELSPKPVAVRDAQAAFVGGKIYIPGGLAEDGQPVSVVEVYDPVTDRWSTAADLPLPLSAYALAVYEGRVYLFGGWDGQSYTDQVLFYDPRDDRWEEGTALDQPRGGAAAVSLSGKIHLIGGTGGNLVINSNQVYLPQLEGTDSSPWEDRAPLPAGRSNMSAAVLADQVYVIGGEDGQNSQSLPALQYQPQQDVWLEIEPALESVGIDLAVLPIDTNLHVIGGRIGDRLLDHHLVYRAIYTVLLPIVQD